MLDNVRADIDEVVRLPHFGVRQRAHAILSWIPMSVSFSPPSRFWSMSVSQCCLRSCLEYPIGSESEDIGGDHARDGLIVSRPRTL